MALQLRDYRRLPYLRTVTMVSDESGDYWVCGFPEIPGLFADGDSRQDAVNNAFSAFDDMIEALIEVGREIPLPARVAAREVPADTSAEPERDRETIEELVARISSDSHNLWDIEAEFGDVIESAGTALAGNILDEREIA